VSELRKRGRVWQAIFYDHTGKRRFASTHCTDKRAAEIAAGRLEREAQDPGHAAEDPTTISDAIELLIQNREELVGAGKRSPETVRMYRVKAGHVIRILENVVVDQDGLEVSRTPLLLTRLTPGAVDDMISTRRAEGAKEHTIAKELVTLRAALKVAKRKDRFAGDIEAIMPHGFEPGYKPVERHLEPELLVPLLSRLTPDHAARAAFTIATSANLGESSRAQDEDVRIPLSSVFIRGTKRTSRRRTVPLARPWQRQLLDFAIHYAQGEAGKLFRFDAGFDDALARACADAKIERLTSNDLRRTFAHWMRRDRIPLELIAPMMGHADTKMLERVYGKLTARELAELMGGTAVAQTNEEQVDRMDQLDNVIADNPLKLVPGAGLEPARAFAQGILSTLPPLPKPREYLRKRSYDGATGTEVAQTRAPGVVVVLPRTRRGGAA